MQNSSQLFPVTLLSAELRGDLIEDVYRLKPGNSPDVSVELALTRLGSCHAVRAVPVVLLPGSFSNRRFWYSPKGIGLGPYLARAGFDVWIAEMRGHGLSPRNEHYARNCVRDYARFDLPAIAEFILETCQQTPHWIGHSLGGITLAAALGGAYLGPQHAASVTLCGSQISRIYWPLKLPPVEWGGRLLLKRLGGFSGTRWQRGPEDEPAGLALEMLRWHGLFGRFGERGNDWWEGLTRVHTPVLALSAEGDRQDPPWACEKLLRQFGSEQREHLRLGRRQGFSSDFGHVEMLISKEAQAEVWPQLLHWLECGQLASAPATLLQS